MMSEEVRFVHDCDECFYLGHYEEYDLYYHSDERGSPIETVIARRSSEGSDYISGMVFSKPYVDIVGRPHDGFPPLVAARIRAIDKGLLKDGE